MRVLLGMVLLLGWGLASTARPQEPVAPEIARVVARVTAVAGASAFLDRGRGDGIAAGDAVELWPVGAGLVVGTVRDVSTGTSRVEVDHAAALVLRPGDRAEVLVPAARLEQDLPLGGSAESAGALPAHTGWTAPLPDWDAELPLLAPVQGRTPDERPATVNGRLHLSSQVWWSDEDRDRRSVLARLGADVRVTNPFGRGGEVLVEGEGFRRETRFDGAPDDTDDRGRVDRASWAVGGTREEPVRLQVGRFLQHAFPQFGVLDGVEVSRRTEAGHVVGASAGLLPDPSDDFRTGDDLAVSAYVRWNEALEDAPVRTGLGLQATWHRGEPDRQLVVGTVDWRADEEVTVAAEAWVDAYDGGDDLKGEGLQLTEARAVARWHPGDTHGGALTLAFLRWPELLRMEFGSLPDELVREGRVARVGLSGWRRLDDDVRLDARVGLWEDEDDDGGSADLDLTLEQVGWLDALSLGAFMTVASFNDGLGLRASARRQVLEAFLRLDYEVVRWDQDIEGPGDVDLTHQLVRIGLDTTLSPTTSLSAFGERRFGDDQDGYVLGLFLQERF